MLLIYFILAVLTYMVLNWWRSRNQPPGPLGLPIVGYLPWLDPKAPHKTLTALSKKYGPIYGLYLGGVYTVVLSDAKLVRKAFAKDALSGRAPLYLTHGIMKGYGLICAEGELWKDQRKFLAGCLRQFGMQKYGPKREQLAETIMREVADCITFIKERSIDNCTTIEPMDVLRHNLGNALNTIVFGVTYERDDGIWMWLQSLQKEGVEHIGVAGPINFLSFLRFLPKYSNVMHYLLSGKEKTHELYQKIIDKRILVGNSDEEPGNVLEAFLAERKRREGTPDGVKFYNNQQFYHLLADVFGAGLDTTITTLCWFLLYMADNVTAQEKLQDELDAIVGKRQITLEDITSLHILQASVAETQRIRSVVPVGIPHGVLEETELEGYAIPKGTMVVPLQWAIHMDPNEWTEPEIYNPQRFLNEEGTFFKADNFIPFQTGKRMCVGDELGYMMLYLFGANILQSFKITATEESQVDLDGNTGITLAPKLQLLNFTLRK